MGDQPQEEHRSGGTSTLERINHWIRIVFGVVAIVAFVAGLIAFFLKRH